MRLHITLDTARCHYGKRFNGLAAHLAAERIWRRANEKQVQVFPGVGNRALLVPNELGLGQQSYHARDQEQGGCRSVLKYEHYDFNGPVCGEVAGPRAACIG